MDAVQTILNALDNPAAKYVLSLLGGYIMSKSPTFKTKAVPIVLGVCSIALSLLHGLFPDTAPATAPAVAAVQVSFWQTFAGQLLNNVIVTGVLPVILAIGTHSGIKNTKQWADQGGGFTVKVERN